jgi:histidine triad (HIT) family protein
MGGVDCVFCRIAEKKMDAPVVHEDDMAVAFRDMNPQAPVHILVVPKKHIRSMGEVGPKDEALLGHLLYVARKLADDEGLPRNGYRIVLNTGANAGQTVFHLHVHLLGGRSFSWPPG